MPRATWQLYAMFDECLLKEATVNCGVETNVLRLLIKGYGARVAKRAVGAISYAEGYV